MNTRTPNSKTLVTGTLSVLLISAACFWGYSASKKSPQNAREQQTPSRTLDPLLSKVDLQAKAINASLLTASVSSDRVFSNRNDRTTCSDDVFLRRTYLNIAGRIPTYDEAQSFLLSNKADKRRQLVETLLESDAYVSHQFNFWADILRVQSRNRVGPAKPYLDFIKDAISRNMHYDKFVSRLLSAGGPFFKKGNGAVGYLLRDFGMPEDSVSNSVRVFLGTRLECAQCHDHPSGDYTRRQYFQMVAFNGGVGYYIDKTESEFDADLQEIDYQDPANAGMREAFMNVVAPLHYGIRGSGTGLARLPEDYQYPDGEKFEVVSAKTIFDGQEFFEKGEQPASVGQPIKLGSQKHLHLIKGASQRGSRRKLAAWMTSPENPRFAKVMANRLWKQAMGNGVFDAVDNLTSQTEIKNVELLNQLEESFKELKFDIKRFLTAVYLSDIYQSKALAQADKNYVGPKMKRMSAEQVWDSLLALTVPDVDRKQSDDAEQENFLGLKDVYASYQKLLKMSPTEIRELVTHIHQGWKDDPASRIRFYFRLDSQPAKFRMEMLAEPSDENKLLRASEQSTPAPPGHFLREFGQSNREQVENGSREITATQLLAMMNGFVEKNILSNADSVLMTNVRKAQTHRQKVETIYVSVLQRKPTKDEAELWMEEFEKAAPSATKELIWLLVNSTEFLFVQ